MDRDTFSLLLKEQYEEFQKLELGVSREILSSLLNLVDNPFIVTISGLRRVGKSTLLAQLGRRLRKDSFYYINFEDERFLNFKASEWNHLYQLLLEIFGERRTFLIDEIQSVEGWEAFVRRMHDQGFKFFITGSNASLLTPELGTKLTGRYKSLNLYPFSFREFLMFYNGKPPKEARSTPEVSAAETYLMRYLHEGGMPISLKYPDLDMAKTVYDGVIYKDIVSRYNIGEPAPLKDLALYLASNPASLVSYNKIKQRMGIKSVTTISNYMDYLEDGWLFFPVNLFSYSIKKQQIAPKKVFSVDTGLIREVGFNFTADIGKLLENVVFLELKRRFSDIYYYVTRSGYEVDFYVPSESLMIQVSSVLGSKETLERENRSLLEAREELEVVNTLILTRDPGIYSYKEEEGVTILPVRNWLLNS